MRTPDRNFTPPPDDDPSVDDALQWTSAASGSRLMEEAVASISLTAPARRPPTRCLTEIHRRLAPAAPGPALLNGHAHARRITARPPSPWSARTGWGLAAAFAVLAGWQTVRIMRAERPSPSPGDHGSAASGGQFPADSPDRGPAGHAESLNPDDPTSPGSRSPAGRSRRTAAGSMVIPDRPALQRRLEELQRLQDSRLQTAPGLARTVVMELRRPGSKPGESTRTTPLSEDVAGIIAAGMEKTRPASASDRPPFTVDGPDKSRPGDDIIISNGLPNFSGFSLRDGVTLYHQNFPADSWQDWEGLHLLRDGSFYDAVNEILWKPVPGEGRRYSGSRPQEPVLLDEQAVPPDTPAPAPPPAAPEVPPAAGPADSGPLIWSIYDESRGEGRLVINDLPPPPAGQSYQLWFEDARSPVPVTAGLLPPLDGGAGQVWFSLTPGISPVNYRLTLEPSAGSPAPLGPTVLTGP